MNTSDSARRYPVGAELSPRGGTRFRVWAPKSRRVEVVFFANSGDADKAAQGAVELDPERDGYFSGTAKAGAGALYKLRLDSGMYPDPASRFQPAGPHGPSQVIDPAGFQWSDRAWRGVTRGDEVIYEMHAGTLTQEGTWRAAENELAALRDLGITILEVMPVADFAGKFGWGYDGVNLFAPTRLYGQPDDFRHFVDRAHAAGLGVILDVVYNHFGPSGNYWRSFSQDYFSSRYKNEWGEPINFDGPQAGPVREFFLANAAYWIDEFHLDGLRLDATQQMFDASEDHILGAIVRRTRAAAPGRKIFMVAENERQSARLAWPETKLGFGFNALWNDDFHHAARVAATGRSEAYYSDYRGSPQELISTVKHGFLYQGQWSRWQKQRRGSPALDLSPRHFTNYLQNHDQVANSSSGARLHQLAAPGKVRALTALLLLSPQIPLLFQGQEFGASSPFLYFADHEPELAQKVRDGRAQFLSQFPSISGRAAPVSLPAPHDPQTFARSRLDLAERVKHTEVYKLHRDLLKLRATDPIFKNAGSGKLDGAVLGAEGFLLRFFGAGQDRLLIVNLGGDLNLQVVPEPLLAPPAEGEWKMIWSSENPKYGGQGAPDFGAEETWLIPAQAAVVFAAKNSNDGKNSSTD